MVAYNGENNEDERESQTKHQNILPSHHTLVYQKIQKHLFLLKNMHPVKLYFKGIVNISGNIKIYGSNIFLLQFLNSEFIFHFKFI